MTGKIWSGESSLRRLLLPLSQLHGLANGTIRFCYKPELEHAWRVPVPVVVVGNLTAGSNERTPVVVWLAEQLQQRDVRVGVVLRGYDDKAESYPLLLSADITIVQAGDEPVLIYQRTDAPVVVSSVCSDAIETILAQHLDVQVIAADDGLQHCRLARDMEIVVVDDVRHSGNGWWLLAGSMHEQAGCLKSVDAVTVNGDIPRNGGIPVYLLPGQAMNLRTGMRCDVAQLEHMVAITGIGHPPCFFATLKACDVQSKECIPLADHQSLNHTGVSALVGVRQTLVMTGEDAVKCRAFTEKNWWYLPVDAQLSGDEPAKLLV